MTRPARRIQRRGRAGFTLIELAIVVTIVGVLAVLAVVGYRKLTLSAKVTEAQNMISAIRMAQEDYKMESAGGGYANIGPNFCPTAGLAQVKTGWNPACAGGGTLPSWTSLTVHVDGPVQFGYSTVAAPAGLPSIAWVDMSKAVTTRPWYVIQAQADLNGDGAAGLNTELVGTSFQNTIFSHQEGE